MGKFLTFVFWLSAHTGLCLPSYVGAEESSLTELLQSNQVVFQIRIDFSDGRKTSGGYIFFREGRAGSVTAIMSKAALGEKYGVVPPVKQSDFTNLLISGNIIDPRNGSVVAKIISPVHEFNADFVDEITFEVEILAPDQIKSLKANPADPNPIGDYFIIACDFDDDSCSQIAIPITFTGVRGADVFAKFLFTVEDSNIDLSGFEGAPVVGTDGRFEGFYSGTSDGKLIIQPYN